MKVNEMLQAYFVSGPVHPAAFSTIDALLNIADHEDA